MRFGAGTQRPHGRAEDHRGKGVPVDVPEIQRTAPGVRREATAASPPWSLEGLGEPQRKPLTFVLFLRCV